MEEQTLFTATDVLVSTARVQFGKTTYPMAGITSVAEVVRPAERAAGAVLAFIGVAGLGAGMVTESTVILAFGVFLALVGIFYMVTRGAKYVAQITTASGRVDALVSEDQKHVASVIAALNNAIIKRAG